LQQTLRNPQEPTFSVSQDPDLSYTLLTLVLAERYRYILSLAGVSTKALILSLPTRPETFVPAISVTAVAVVPTPKTTTMPIMEHHATSSVTLMLLCMIAFFVGLANSDCHCGYQATINAPSYPYPAIFTDLVESDFLHLANVSLDTDWRPQQFPVTAAAGRGPYGMNFTVRNVVSNPILNASNWTGPGEFGGDPGLQLLVGGGIPSNGYVQVAQINSAREDMLWGTYRAAMKLTLAPGTCSAFFWVSSFPNHRTLTRRRIFIDSKLIVGLVLQRLTGNRHGVPVV
jgi:hypothetical protein